MSVASSSALGGKGSQDGLSGPSSSSNHAKSDVWGYFEKSRFMSGLCNKEYAYCGCDKQPARGTEAAAARFVSGPIGLSLCNKEYTYSGCDK